VIVVDASAILAILFDEPDGPAFRTKLITAGGTLISPVNHWEVLVAARRNRGEAGFADAEALMETLDVTVAQIGPAQSRAAAQAFARFGKPARGGLNLGDCFAYAQAAAEGDGLVFKGDDFTRTDIPAA
jgi:ribonuclease VapC